MFYFTNVNGCLYHVAWLLHRRVNKNIFCLCVGEVDYKEIGDCVHVSGFSSTDLCLPALDYLRKCSQV